MRYMALVILLVLGFLALGPLMLDYGRKMRDKVRGLWKESEES